MCGGFLDMRYNEEYCNICYIYNNTKCWKSWFVTGNLVRESIKFNTEMEHFRRKMKKHWFYYC